MIECHDVIKVYTDPFTGLKVSALRGLDLKIQDGKLVSIIGPSGAGKTTLIRIISGMDIPTGGDVIVNDTNIGELTEEERRAFRYKNMGIINQFVSENIYLNLSVKDNIMLPQKMQFLPREVIKKETFRLLKTLNLTSIAENLAKNISGGEAVRLSLGVALAKKPKILLADEPTGQLDSENTKDIILTLKEINLAFGTTILVVTHDVRFRNYFERSYIIRDGRLVGIASNLGKSELKFLMESSDLTRSYMDPSNFVRIPDKIKILTGLNDLVEFDVHPSGKVGIFWNPDILTREKVQQILFTQPKVGKEKIKEMTMDDLTKLYSRVFIPPEKSEIIIELKGLKKSYKAPKGENIVLKGIDLKINKCDIIFVSGPSGVGKTTLFNLISGVDTAEEGEVRIFGKNIFEMAENERDLFRLKNIAYITQKNNLLDIITIKDFFILPFVFLHQRYPWDLEKTAKECYIEQKLEHYSTELSAGEQQRAALASAILRKTPIIIADEPTANLDSELARKIIDLLMDIVHIDKITVLLCSHDLSLLRPGFRHINLLDGKIVKDERVTEQSLKKTIQEYLNIKNV